MRRQVCRTVGLVGLGVMLAAGPSAAQSGSAARRTPHGDPDIQGIFTFRTITPLERPENLGDKATLSAEEAAAFEAAERVQRRILAPIPETDRSTAINILTALAGYGINSDDAK